MIQSKQTSLGTRPRLRRLKIAGAKIGGKNKMEKEFTNEYVKYIFSENEQKEIAAEMAQKVSDLQQAEDVKKRLMADYKTRIDEIQANVNNAATKLNSGYEMRSIKCEIVPHWAKKVWEYIRTDNGKVAREKSMTTDDLQMQFEE